MCIRDRYYSTNHQASDASLEEAVVKGLGSDKGLYRPEGIKPLPQELYNQIENLSFQEIAYREADAFFGEDVSAETLKQIVHDRLSFDVPAVKVKDNICLLYTSTCLQDRVTHSSTDILTFFGDSNRGFGCSGYFADY